MVVAAGQQRIVGIPRHHSPVIHSLNWSGYAVARAAALSCNVRAVYFVP
jgi:hypothetical protein